MRRMTLVWTLCSAALWFAGCGMQPNDSGSQAAGPDTPHGGLAVIDLDLVAKTLGREQQMNEELEKRQGDLNQRLVAEHAQARQAFEDKQKQYGEQPTEAQQKELAQLQNQLNLQLGNSQRKAQIELEVYKQELIRKFRSEVRPVAQEVAAARGLSVVIPKNEGFLLSIDPGVDITSQVIDRMRTQKPTTPAPTQAAAPETTATR